MAGFKSQRYAPESGDRRFAAEHGGAGRWRRLPATRRFRTALIDLCFERGFADLTVGDVCRSAGLSPAVFRSHYPSLEDCFLQICGGELRRYRRIAAAAASGSGEWRARLRAAAYALYRTLDEDERLRRLTLVESRAAGERSARLIDEAIESVYDLIDEGRAQATAPSTLTRATAEFLGAAVFNELYLACGHRGPLPPEGEVVPKLMYLTVLSYRGPNQAAEELRIPPPSR